MTIELIHNPNLTGGYYSLDYAAKYSNTGKVEYNTDEKGERFYKQVNTNYNQNLSR